MKWLRLETCDLELRGKLVPGESARLRFGAYPLLGSSESVSMVRFNTALYDFSILIVQLNVAFGWDSQPLL